MTTLAIWLTKHTWVIGHQTFLVRMHCNTYWLNCDKFLHTFYSDWVFFFIIGIAYFFLPCNFFAVFLASKVERRVILFLDDSMSLCIFICIKHPSSSASKVDWITVDEILDWKSLWSFVLLNSESSFYCDSCGKGPTRSTTTLITWSSKFTRLLPVD